MPDTNVSQGFHLHNMMTCEGFNNPGFMGDCSMTWLFLVLLVFLGLIVRRQAEDGILQGSNYNMVFGFIGGGLGYLIIIIFFGAPQIAFVVGLIAMMAGGFGSSMLGIGGSE